MVNIQFIDKLILSPECLWSIVKVQTLWTIKLLPQISFKHGYWEFVLFIVFKVHVLLNYRQLIPDSKGESGIIYVQQSSTFLGQNVHFLHNIF